MERAGRVIGKLKNSGMAPEDLARAAWPVAVGPRLADRTGPVYLVRSRLVVEVDDETWRKNLYSLRGQILRNVEKVVGAGVIEELEFRVRIARRGPQVEHQLARTGDDSDGIQDPVLRMVYRNARKKAASA